MLGSYSVVATLATGEGSTATATTTASRTVARYQDDDRGGVVTNSSVPNGIVPVGARTYLAPNGDLYTLTGTTTSRLVASNVTQAKAFQGNDDGLVISFIAGGKAYSNLLGSGTNENYASVPAGSKVIGPNGFLGPDGDLYYKNTKLLGSVTSASTIYYSASNLNQWFYYIQSDGTIGATNTGFDNRPNAMRLPGGTVLVPGTAGVWLTPAGDLYAILNGRVPTIAIVDRNVASAAVDYLTTQNGIYRINYVSATGTFNWIEWTLDLDGRPTGRTATLGTWTVPVGSRALGGGSVLAPNGDLLIQGTKVDSGVATALGQDWAEPHKYIVTWAQAVC